MKLEITRTCPGFFPHYFDGAWLIASRRNGLYRTNNMGQSWERIGRFYSGWRRALTYIRLIERISNCAVSDVIPFGEGQLFAITGNRQRWQEKGNFTFQTVNNSPIGHRPFRRNLLRGYDGSLFVAEYIDNFGEDRGDNQRNPVYIYRCEDIKKGIWHPVYQFDKASIRHIHALIHDEIIKNRSWVCTGDADDESFIYYSDDEFQTLTLFAADGQNTRTCDLLFTEDFVYWGVDSPLKQSGIIRKSRDGARTDWLCDVPCPVYFGATNANGHLFFTTCVEPGPSVTSSHTELYASVDGESFFSVFSLRADFLPQYSMFHLPKGQAPDNTVVFYARATLRSENTLFVGQLRP